MSGTPDGTPDPVMYIIRLANHSDLNSLDRRLVTRLLLRMHSCVQICPSGACRRWMLTPIRKRPHIKLRLYYNRRTRGYQTVELDRIAYSYQCESLGRLQDDESTVATS